MGSRAPALRGDEKKTHPLPGATSHLSPPPAAPSQRCRRRRRGCRPGARRRGIFAPRHCEERERDGGEITARRDPGGGEAAPARGRTPHVGPGMPPPALKGAHKATLPRARGGPSVRREGARPNLSLGADGEVTPRRLRSRRPLRRSWNCPVETGRGFFFFFLSHFDHGPARLADWSLHLFGPS